MNRALMVTLTAALSACSMDPSLPRPEAAIPPSWPVGDAYLRQTETALPSVNYRDIFSDRRLQALIEQSLETNRDLRIAAANIMAARAQYRVQRAQRFPRLDASSAVGVTGGGGASNGRLNGDARMNFAVQAGASAFEIDLFGRLASLSRAEQNRYLATEAAARATRLALVSDIATAWLTHAADATLIEIARQTAASAQRSVDLTSARLRGGVAPRSDLRQAEQVLATAQADLAQQQTFLAQDVNAPATSRGTIHRSNFVAAVDRGRGSDRRPSSSRAGFARVVAQT